LRASAFPVAFGAKSVIEVGKHGACNMAVREHLAPGFAAGQVKAAIKHQARGIGALKLEQLVGGDEGGVHGWAISI
jgi:hypothetical protein